MPPKNDISPHHSVTSRIETHALVDAKEATRLMFDGLPSYLRTRVRHSAGKGTFLLPISKIYAHCLSDPSQKYFATPGVFKRGTSSQHTSQLHKIGWRVIDLDCAGVASEEAICNILARLRAPVTWSNGIQIRLKPSGDWKADAPRLAAIGRMLAKITGLQYDETHLNKDGWPGRQEAHCYRLPLSWASRANRPALTYHPILRDGMAYMTVDEAFAALGCTLPESPKLTRGRSITCSTARTPHSGSQSPRYEEFSRAMQMLWDGRKAGLSREQAYKKVSSHSWNYLAEDSLRRSFSKYVPIWETVMGDGEFVPNGLDQVEYRYFLTNMVSKRQRVQQRTWKLFAHRAWSLNLFYELGFEKGEILAAFIRWKPLRVVRRLSIKALGRRGLKKDIMRCIEKFADGEGARPADDTLVANVWNYVESTFSSSPAFRAMDIPRWKVGVTSHRHLQRILGMLKSSGKLAFTVRKWRIAHSSPSSLSNNLCMARKVPISTPPSFPMKTTPTPPFDRTRFQEILTERDSQHFYEYLIALPIPALKNMLRRLQAEAKRNPDDFAIKRELNEVRVGLKSAEQIQDFNRKRLRSCSEAQLEHIAADTADDRHTTARILLHELRVKKEAKSLAAASSLDGIRRQIAEMKAMRKEVQAAHADLKVELTTLLEIAIQAEKILLEPEVNARRERAKRKRLAALQHARYQGHIIDRRDEEERKAMSAGCTASEAFKAAREALPQFFRPRKYAAEAH